MPSPIEDLYAANTQRLNEAQARLDQPDPWTESQRSQIKDYEMLDIPERTYRTGGWGTHITGKFNEGKRLAAQLANSARSKHNTANQYKRDSLDFWDTQRRGFEEANIDTLRDRGAMLQELGEFKANSLMNDEYIERTVDEKRESLRANTREILDRVQNNFAQMGRAAPPMMLANLQRKLALQNQDEIDTTRAAMEIDKAKLRSTYIDQLYNVLGGTRREVMDPQLAMQIMQQMGSASSPVSSAGGGVSMGLGNASGSRSQFGRTGGGGNTSRFGQYGSNYDDRLDQEFNSKMNSGTPGGIQGVIDRRSNRISGSWGDSARETADMQGFGGSRTTRIYG